MKQAARAIIVKDNSLLVMERNKFGSKYYVLIGGGVDLGEQPEDALVREVREETGLEVSDKRLVIIEEAGEPYGTQFVYLCSVVDDSNVQPSPDSEEYKITQLGQNTYNPMWLPLEKLPSITMRSKAIADAILDGIKNGFPEQPKRV